MAGEDLVFAQDDDGFNEAAIGLEARIFFGIFPNPNILTVGAGVEEAAGSGEGIYMAFFTDEGADQGRLPVLGGRGVFTGVGMLLGPRGGTGGGELVPRGQGGWGGGAALEASGGGCHELVGLKLK
ncbi:unnamed protein product [Cuscuta epithymum]|uniref:Dirigent protein n=1 Tax=Cuscuta epithymum TaxID=186058 RepID=A0AAV0E3U5_9ASTE|nr:unnamed protein product [Cuscuta epithymum]